MRPNIWTVLRSEVPATRRSQSSIGTGEVEESSFFFFFFSIRGLNDGFEEEDITCRGGVEEGIEGGGEEVVEVGGGGGGRWEVVEVEEE